MLPMAKKKKKNPKKQNSRTFYGFLENASPTSLNLSHLTFASARYTSASQIISVSQTFEVGPFLRVTVFAVPMEGNTFP